MPLIGTLIDFEPNVTARSSDVDENFNAIRAAFNDTAVLTDVAKTIGVTHTFSVTQTFGGGASFGAPILPTVTLTPDIGSAGLRWRDIYGRNADLSGTLTVTGNIGVGGAPSGDWNTGFQAVQTSNDAALWANKTEAQSFWSTGVRYTAGGYLYTQNGLSGAFHIAAASGSLSFNTAPGGAAGTAAGLVERGRFTNNGIFAWGTTVTTGASAGDMVLGSTKNLRIATAAGTGSVHLIGTNTSDQLLIGSGTSRIHIDPSGTAIVLVGTSNGLGARAGDLVLANDLVFTATEKVIRANTGDGADTYRLTITGGGARTTAQGGFVDVYGNDHAANPGDVILAGGATTGRILFVANNGNEVGRVTGNGIFAWATAVTTSAAAGNLVMGYTESIRGVTAAGTDTFEAMRLNGDSISLAVDVSTGNAGIGVNAVTPTAGNTALYLHYSGSVGATYKQVSIGAPDSGGAGFRYLRVPN